MGGGAPAIEDVRQTAAVHLRGSDLRMGTYHSGTCCNPVVGSSVGTGRGPGTWPSARVEAAASADPAAVRTGTGEGPGRTAEAGSDAAAVVLCAVLQKMKEIYYKQILTIQI